MTPKEWRSKRNLTVDQVADMLGFSSPGYISDVENGKKGGSLKLAQAYHKISKGLVSLNDFQIGGSK